MKVTDSTLKNTSNQTNEDSKKPTEDEEKKIDVPTAPNDQNVVTNNQLQFITNNTSAKPTTPSTTEKKTSSSLIVGPTEIVKPAVVPPKDMAGKRVVLEKKDLDALLASPKLTASEKALVEEYIKMINSPTGVTRDQTGSMFTLIDKMNSVGGTTSAPTTTNESISTEPNEDAPQSLNIYKNSGMLSVFEKFVDPKLGIDQTSFDYNKIHELLTKEAVLTSEEKNYLAQKYFEVLENPNPAFLKQLPLHDRMKSVLNLCFWQSDFMDVMTKKYETADQFKIKMSKLEKKMISTFLYGFALNQKLNPNASKVAPKDQITAYISDAEPIDVTTKAKKKQKYRVLSLGRFDFSDPTKKTLSADDLAFAKDINVIWSAVEETMAGSLSKISVVGHVAKTGDDMKDVAEADKLAKAVKKDAQFTFNTESYGSQFPLPNEKRESIQNRRVEVMIYRAQAN